MELDHFHGVYLLYNENPQYKGRTYIGYTVNPNRRIRQHNIGKQAGGASRTHGKGPWAMALIIHGFPNDISGLRFEWAWQNPEKSRILKKLGLKKWYRETGFQYRFRIALHMLRSRPWRRLSLTIRWLIQDYVLDFPADLNPPDHVAIAYGPVKRAKVTQKHKVPTDGPSTTDEHIELDTLTNCAVCKQSLPSDDALLCYSSSCNMAAHTFCLADWFLKGDDGELLPISGECVQCRAVLFWGDLVRLRSNAGH